MSVVWFLLGLTLGAAITAAVLLLRRRQEESAARRLMEAARDAFGSLSRDALSRNTEDFLKIAVDRFGQQAVQGEQALDKKKELIDAHLRQMAETLTRLAKQVEDTDKTRAESHGILKTRLEEANKATLQLQQTTAQLREALSSSQRRGQWGERMAEDVLRLAGFTENVNYRKQAQLGGPDSGSSGRPDFTFDLPKGHVLHMDVKFPLSSYLRYIDAQSEVERAEHLKSFLRDVRTRVRELSKRNYSDGDKPTVDYVLLFLPNEQLTGFIHEHDPALLDDALGQRVVMCSPLTLFAFLGVIRQAFDNFMIEQTSDEILKLVGAFNVQWSRYTESADKVKRQFQQVHSEFDALTTTRERMLERPLQKIEALRKQRSLTIADVDEPDEVDGDGTPMLRAVGRDL